MPKLPKYSTMVMLKPDKNYEIEYEILSSYFLNDVESDFEEQKEESLNQIATDVREKLEDDMSLRDRKSHANDSIMWTEFLKRENEVWNYNQVCRNSNKKANN